MTEPSTRTLEVPGATMTYDVRGDLAAADPERPPLFLSGSPMDASGFPTLATHFTDRPVVTYDPRGAERSPKAPTTSRPRTTAPIWRRVIAALGVGPVDLFGTSGGAVNVLALVAGTRRTSARCRTRAPTAAYPA